MRTSQGSVCGGQDRLEVATRNAGRWRDSRRAIIDEETDQAKGDHAEEAETNQPQDDRDQA